MADKPITKLEPVTSSNVMAVGYNKEAETMEIRFHSGKTYRYFPVDASTHKRIKNAASVGSEVNKFIKSFAGTVTKL